eukprot:2478659-Rhodomonas_salina.1
MNMLNPHLIPMNFQRSSKERSIPEQLENKPGWRGHSALLLTAHVTIRVSVARLSAHPRTVMIKAASGDSQAGRTVSGLGRCQCVTHGRAAEFAVACGSACDLPGQARAAPLSQAQAFKIAVCSRRVLPAGFGCRQGTAHWHCTPGH